ncbi:MAG TPA: hypothetical protein DCE76_11345 [Anaerolineaceae bacterium]|nr:hypothetical protein [Anaerolineaceae bacterium]
MGATVLEIILGAIIAIVITVLVESFRKPKLELKIDDPADILYTNRPVQNVRFLRIELKNKSLPKMFQWLQRSAALQCHGTIEFYHLDGQNVFGRAMPIRWSSSPEPVPMFGVIGDQKVLLFDPARFTLTPRIDVYPGESERLDIAAKFDDDTECYGWSNESYFSNPVWRNPNWCLPKGRYLFRVTIITAGEKFSETFRLINDVPRKDFRIEFALPNDKIYL